MLAEVIRELARVRFELYEDPRADEHGYAPAAFLAERRVEVALELRRRELAPREDALGMPRPATGNAFASRGQRYARVTIAKGQRRAFALAATTNEQAEARASALAALAAELRGKGQGVDAGLVERLVERAASAADGKPFDDVLEAARAIASGEARRTAGDARRRVPTFRDVARRWTSGEASHATTPIR